MKPEPCIHPCGVLLYYCRALESLPALWPHIPVPQIDLNMTLVVIRAHVSVSLCSSIGYIADTGRSLSADGHVILRFKVTSREGERGQPYIRLGSRSARPHFMSQLRVLEHMP